RSLLMYITRPAGREHSMDPFWDRAISNNNNDPDDDEEKRPTRRHHAEKKSTRPDHKMAVDSDDEDKMAIDSDLEERAVVDLADFTDPDGRGTPYTPLDADQCIEMLRDEIEESGGTVYQDSLNCFARSEEHTSELQSRENLV